MLSLAELSLLPGYSFTLRLGEIRGRIKCASALIEYSFPTAPGKRGLMRLPWATARRTKQ